MATSPRLLTRLSQAAQALRGVPRADAAPPTAEVREDTVNAAGGTRSGASVVNALSGVGDVRDSGAIAKPNINREYLTTEELVAMLRGSLYRRICMLPPWEATRRGFTLSDDTDEAQPLAKPLRTHKVLKKLRRASFLARALSESRIWLIVDDGQPQDQPLRIDRVKKVIGLHVLDVNEFSPATYQGDPLEADDLGWPETYNVHPVRMGIRADISKPVHHTRLLRFIGDELPPSCYSLGTSSGSGYADAVGQTIWDSIRNLNQTSAAGARLAQELSVFVLYMANMPAQDSEKRSLFRAALRTLMQVKSVANGLVLGPNDRAERLTATAAGFKDISEDSWQHLQATTSIPAPLLRMSTPGGLNTDGQSWQTGWYGSTVPAFQEEHIREPLETIIQCLYMAEHGGIPDEWKLIFNPLQEPTPLERAQVYSLVMQADRQALEMGLVTASQIRRSRFAEGGMQVDMQPATEEDEQELEFGPGGVSAEEAEASLAELAALVGGQTPGATPPQGEEGEPSATPAAATPGGSPESDERLNGAQLKSAQEILSAVVSQALTAEAAALLLAEVVGEQKAQALVRAQRGAKAPSGGAPPMVEAGPAPKQDVWHSSADRSMPDVLLGRLDAGEMTWDEAVVALDADLPASVRKMRIKVPAFMQRNAELGMELRGKFGRGMPAPEGGGAATGAETAADLKSGEIGAARVLLMAAWFARHFAPEQLKAKRQAEGWQDPENPSSGWIAALGWGDKGDGRAKAWVERQAKKVNAAIEAAKEREDADFTGKAVIMARLSAKGQARWRELVQQVEGITGPLEGYEPGEQGIQNEPHATVLYLGAVDPAQLDEIAAAMREEAKRHAPEALILHRVRTLPAGPVSGDRMPVVAQVGTYVLETLHNRLLRDLAHLVRAKQFRWFEQHVTLGFAKSLDGDQLTALKELVPDRFGPGCVPASCEEGVPKPVDLGAVGEVVLLYGGELVASAPFLGHYDGEAKKDRREDEGPVGNEVEQGERGAGEE